MAARAKPLHILVLADRDWTHHDTGGNGANLDAQISRWVAWGNRVTVVAGDYPGAKRVERFGPLLTVHRMGTRLTVFPKAAWAVLRGVGRDADVVLEVINGITFLTPLWLRKPRVAMVHHVHRELYVGEFPRTGLLLYWVLERLPLLLYRRTPFLTISNSARDDLVRDGIPRELVTVEYLGVDPGNFRRGTRSETPRLIFVGRLKAYKRVELLLDVLEQIPEATLDVVGDGDHRPDLEAEIERRRPGRPRADARLRGPRAQDRALRAGLGEPDRVRLGGVVADRDGGGPVRHPQRARCRWAGCRSRSWTARRACWPRTRQALAARVRELIEQPELRERLGDAAERRARSFSWDRSARAYLEVLERRRPGSRPSRASRRPCPPRPPRPTARVP